MQLYNATVELDTREPVDHARIVDALADYSPAVSTSMTGRPEITLSTPAASLRQAVTTALAAVETATGRTVLSVDAMPSTEFDVRAGFDVIPEMLSVTDAAVELGVTRARVIQLISAGTLAAKKVGSTWVLPTSAVHARAAAQAGRGTAS